MSRKKSREIAFQLVYGLGFDPFVFDETIPVTEQQFIDKLVAAVRDNQTTIDETIAGLSSVAFAKIYPVDLAALRIGIAEIKYVGTPKPVVIEQCADLAKKYSLAESPGFVSGVLGAL